MERGSRARGRWPLIVVLALGVLLTGIDAAGAQQGDRDPAAELAERHAPVLVLKAQDDECDTDGEPYLPTSVDIVLDNPEVVLRQSGGTRPVLMRAPGAADLFGGGAGTHLDFPGDSLDPGCVYEADNRRLTGDRAVVYAHVASQADRPGLLALQYWFFWYYNDWNNKHEGDWEGIQLVFEADSVDEALTVDPIEVGYAQHEGGERAGWGSSKLERIGDRPVVYPSAGSHASYFGSALYLGRSGSEGFGCDNTDGPSRQLDPEVVVLPDTVDDPSDPLAWLAFEGRWGEEQSGPFNGPTGPQTKGRWTAPFEWQDELRDASVVVPAGDSAGNAVIDVFCAATEVGSGLLVTATRSPLVLLVLILLAVGIWRFLAARTDWTPVEALPLRRRRSVGQSIRSALLLYRSHWRAMLGIGAVHLPVAFLAGLLVGLARWLVPFTDALLELVAARSGFGVVFVIIIGSAGNLLALVIVGAAVADYLDDLDDGRTARGVASYRSVFAHLRPLASGTLRAALVVVGLAVTVIGLPWAIRQLVRYQLVPQVVVLEERSGAAATARSSELVIGRWGPTAALVVSATLLVQVTGMVVSLLVLLVLVSLPIWAFGLVVASVHAIVSPLGALAVTLWYGDAVAEEDGRPAAEPLEVAT
ncbi:MAG: hypothetical protein AAFZ07_08365 [Actinomycetota bacterium]